MFRGSTSATRLTSPDLMSSSRLLARQCRLVGKLMIYRERICRSRLENEHPAGLYFASLAGSLVRSEVRGVGPLELWAIPRPITRRS